MPPKHLVDLLFRNHTISRHLHKELLGGDGESPQYASVKDQKGIMRPTFAFCHVVEKLVKEDKHEQVDLILGGAKSGTISCIVLAFKAQSLEMAKVIYRRSRNDRPDTEILLEDLDMIKVLLIRVKHEELGILYMRSLRTRATQQQEAGRHTTQQGRSEMIHKVRYKDKIQTRNGQLSPCWTELFLMYVPFYIKPEARSDQSILHLIEDPSQEYIDCYRVLRPDKYPFGLW